MYSTAWSGSMKASRESGSQGAMRSTSRLAAGETDLGFGRTARSFEAAATAFTKLGRSGSRCVTRNADGGSSVRKRVATLLK